MALDEISLRRERVRFVISEAGRIYMSLGRLDDHCGIMMRPVFKGRIEEIAISYSQASAAETSKYQQATASVREKTHAYEKQYDISN